MRTYKLTIAYDGTKYKGWQRQGLTDYTIQQILEEGGIPATVRRTLGGDIDASCGQLRRKYTKEA